MKKSRKYLKDLIPISINRLVLYDGSFEFHFDGNTLSLVPETYGKRSFLTVFVNNIRQSMSWDLYERPHRGRLKWPASGSEDTELGVFDGTGGGSWRDGSLPASSSLRLCG